MLVSQHPAGGTLGHSFGLPSLADFLGLNQPRGYYVVSAAVLVKLKPEFGLNTDLVSFVDTLIRDTANPSVQDAVRGGSIPMGTAPL